jgi:hypothetical protein
MPSDGYFFMICFTRCLKIEIKKKNIIIRQYKGAMQFWIWPITDLAHDSPRRGMSHS